MKTMVLRSERTLSGRNRLHAALFVGATAGTRERSPAAATAIRFTRHGLLFAGLWVFIGLVGSLDTFLTVKYRVVLPALEQNPMGNLLIRVDGQDVSLFVGCKMAGTIVALGLLAWVGLHCRRSFALSIIVPVALGQLTLVFYLFS